MLRTIFAPQLAQPCIQLASDRLYRSTALTAVNATKQNTGDWMQRLTVPIVPSDQNFPIHGTHGVASFPECSVSAPRKVSWGIKNYTFSDKHDHACLAQILPKDGDDRVQSPGSDIPGARGKALKVPPWLNH